MSCREQTYLVTCIASGYVLLSRVRVRLNLAQSSHCASLTGFPRVNLTTTTPVVGTAQQRLVRPWTCANHSEFSDSILSVIHSSSVHFKTRVGAKRSSNPLWRATHSLRVLSGVLKHSHHLTACYAQLLCLTRRDLALGHATS
jgi:hypothetical protein